MPHDPLDERVRPFHQDPDHHHDKKLVAHCRDEAGNEGPGIWEELDHAQSREIQQHHARQHYRHRSLPPSPASLLSSSSSSAAARRDGNLPSPLPTSPLSAASPLRIATTTRPGSLPNEDSISSPSQGHGSYAGATIASERRWGAYDGVGWRDSLPSRKQPQSTGIISSVASEWTRFASVFTQAATEAWQEQRRHRTRRPRPLGLEEEEEEGHRLEEPWLFSSPSRRQVYPYVGGDEEDGPTFGMPLLWSNDDPSATSTTTPARTTRNTAGGAPPTDFVLLSSWRRRPPSEGWGAVANLDVFWTVLYHYYYHRGWVPLLCKAVVEITSLLLAGLLSILLYHIDWAALSTCHSEMSCRDHLSAYLNFYHGGSSTRPSSSLLGRVVMFVYAILLTSYLSFAVWSWSNTLHQAWLAKWVFEERLGISARKLQGGAVDWNDHVVNKLVQLQQSGEYRVAIHDRGQDLDALIIAQRIMRKENFLIALFNRNLLDLSVPILSGAGRHHSSPPTSFFSSTLEWSIYFCILNFMFNHKYEIRPAFYLDPAALRRRLRLCGVAHAVFLPFLLFFYTLYFGLQHMYDWKSTKQYLGPREWSLQAKWIFREFNELQHNFERRLAPSYQAAATYLDLFGPNEMVAALGRILVFIGGSLGAVLLGLAAMNDAILLYVKIADWNLLWYLGMVGIVYSVGKAMIPDSKAQPRYLRNMFAEIDTALAEVASHTHHYPEIWKGRGWDAPTKKSFSVMFQYKVQLFAWELLSIIVAPYILCVSLPNCADAICEFILTVRVNVPGTGDVCGYATFDFGKFSDESILATDRSSAPELLAGSLAESIFQLGSVDAATRRFPKPKARHQKMEKSFRSFKAAHPTWSHSSSAAQLGEPSMQEAESDTAAHERKLHLEIASRQLETLAELEEGLHTLPQRAVAAIDENYIAKAHTTGSAL